MQTGSTTCQQRMPQQLASQLSILPRAGMLLSVRHGAGGPPLPMVVPESKGQLQRIDPDSALQAA